MYGLIPTVGLMTLFTGKVTLVPMQYMAGTSIKKRYFEYKPKLPTLEHIFLLFIFLSACIIWR